MIRNTQHKSPPSWEHSHNSHAHGQDYANVRQFVCMCDCVCNRQGESRVEENASKRMKWHKTLIFLMFFLSEHTIGFFVTPTLHCLVTFLSFSLPLLVLFKLFPTISGGRASASALLARTLTVAASRGSAARWCQKNLFHLNLLHSPTPLFALHFFLSLLLCVWVCVHASVCFLSACFSP